jgi:hypothetical protein
VDEAGKTIYGLWIRSRTAPCRRATGAVENRAVIVDERRLRIAEDHGR